MSLREGVTATTGASPELWQGERGNLVGLTMNLVNNARGGLNEIASSLRYRYVPRNDRY